MTSRTAVALERIAAPLRARRVQAAVAGTAGAVLLALGLWAWLVRLGAVTEPAWVIGAWTGAAILVGLATWLTRARLGHLGGRQVAHWLERAGAWRLGALRAVLEPAQPQASAELARAADERLARDVEARGSEALAPVRHELGREARLAGGVLLAGAALLGAARPFRGAPSLLWHPARALDYALAPVRLTASDTAVARGGTVTLAVRAYGRRDATLWLRAPGEPWRAIEVPLDSLGEGTHEVPLLQADLHARATAGGRESDTVHVAVVQPVFLASLAVTARYPKYLGLDDEPVPTTGDTVLVPEGTRLEAAGEVTTPLVRVAWAGPDTTALEVEGARFAGQLVPRRSGTYRLEVATVSGTPLSGEPVTIPVRVVPDLAPVLEIPVPGADTNAAADITLPVVVDVRDDHGVRSVVLETRRTSALGVAEPVRREALPLPTGTTDRALLSGAIDLKALGLQPGDTLRYRAVATDNAPGRQAGASREFVLRILTRTEARAEQRRGAEAAGAKLDSLAAESRKLERATEDLARSQPRDAAGQNRAAQELSFEQAQKAEAIADRQQQLLQEAEAAERQLAELERQAEAAGIADSAWQQRMAEVRQQLERAMTPELREKLRELREALKELDAERTQDALKDLAARQEELREALERAKELFERAALEGDMANLADESRELAQEQQRWNQQLEQASPQQAAKAEQQLAQRADSLAKALQALAKEMDGAQQQQALEQAAQRAEQAAQQMKQAAQSAQKGQKPQAKQQGQQAQQQLEPLGDELDEQREEMQSEWREEVVEALDRALADASRLAERQLAVQEAFERGDVSARTRAEQGAIEEGVERLTQQLREASGKNALVSPQLAGALGAAKRQMQKAREAVGNANPNAREAGERAGEALDAMNAAAHGMLRARGDVSGSQSGSGMAEAMEKMGKMAGQQGQLSKDAAGLLPMMGGQGGSPQQMGSLAERQRALAEQLERMRGTGNIPGAGEMANEAKELAKRLEAGRLDRGTVERQERLFRRMLDAGRTLQGEQEDERKERQSTAAQGDSVRLPPALRARLEDEAGRVRLPTWEELQRLSPAERRIVVDYFRRLSAPGATR